MTELASTVNGQGDEGPCTAWARGSRLYNDPDRRAFGVRVPTRVSAETARRGRSHVRLFRLYKKSESEKQRKEGGREGGTMPHALLSSTPAA